MARVLPLEIHIAQCNLDSFIISKRHTNKNGPFVEHSRPRKWLFLRPVPIYVQWNSHGWGVSTKEGHSVRFEVCSYCVDKFNVQQDSLWRKNPGP
ncbi:MAG: hypothetical protein RLZZ123_2538 [Pseudomonadota bacterium]